MFSDSFFPGTNSIKFTRESVSLLVQSRNGNLFVSVQDDGRGIDANDLPHLFSAFSRLESKIGGTGLGLCISKSLVEMMKGSIGARSEVGQGSLFYFEIPCEFGSLDMQKGGWWPYFFGSRHFFFFFFFFFLNTRIGSTVSLMSSSVDDMFVSLSSSSKSGAPRVADPPLEERDLSDADFLTFTLPPPLHVLVVDDTEINLKLMTRSLERMGLVATGAASGREALELAAENVYDLILLDMFMPEMSGSETCAELRKIPAYAKAPIVCVTVRIRKDVESFVFYVTSKGV